MAQALTSPFLLAALVLCIAGGAKLRSPAAASRAAATLGLPSRLVLVRAFGLLELAVGCWSAAAPGRPAAAAMTCLYAIFSVLSVLLARRRAACGCFGASEAPTSTLQPLLSGIFAIVALAAMLVTPHGLGWVLGRPPMDSLVLLLGTAGAAYGTVLLYSELPQAWTSWSGR